MFGAMCVGAAEPPCARLRTIIFIHHDPLICVICTGTRGCDATVFAALCTRRHTSAGRALAMSARIALLPAVQPLP